MVFTKNVPFVKARAERMNVCSIKQRVYLYIMTHDSGIAPCVDNGKLSLAVCKGGMRKSIGDNLLGRKSVDEIIVIWLCGKTCKGSIPDQYHKIIYVAKIKKENVMETEVYHSTYTERQDNLYHPMNGKLVRNGKKEGVHDTYEIQNKDLNFKYIFITDDFIYYGDRCILFPDELAVLEKKIQNTYKDIVVI